MTFWQRYENLCKEHNISPSGSEMVNLLGVSSAAIIYWKKQNSSPKNFEIYKKLAKYFSVDIRYLLGISDFPHGEDVIAEMTEKMIDCGAEIYPYDDDKGVGREFAVEYDGNSYNYQEHEYRKLCEKLLTKIHDSETTTVNQFCRENFSKESILESTISLSPEEQDILKKYRLLSADSQIVIKAKIIEELRRKG